MTITSKPAVRLLCAIVCALAYVGVVMSSAQAHDTAPKPAFTVAFPQDDRQDERNRLQLSAVKAVLDGYPTIELIVPDAQGDKDRHIRNIHTMIERQVDLMLISPRDTATLTPVISQVRNRGIPVVVLSKRIMNDDYTAFVAPNEDKIAQRAAVHMARELSHTGRIMILQGDPSDTLAMKRTEAFLKEIAKYEDIRVVALKSSRGLSEDAVTVITEAIEDGLQFDAVFAQTKELSRAARMAMKNTGIDPKSKVVIGVEYTAEAREAIRQGEQRAAFTYPTSGREGALLAVKILSGLKVARDVEVPSHLVTSRNVEWVDTLY